ncbi:hypothetical protein ACFUOZ_00605 [Paenarthrobacter sp. NPDC057355]|uniref:hypothetical protein n=1 Tax=Paenarthrobacter sp. NPDC057355 TaxID=3346105 RepID=UPI003643CE35
MHHHDEDERREQTRALVFRGGRFELDGVHINGLAELLRYQKLFLEIGKDIWREVSGDNVPTPKFLEDLLQLRLMKLKDGSVDTEVRPDYAPALEYEDDDDVVKSTVDRIDEVFRQITSGIDIRHDFTEGSRNAFKDLGRGFRGDERVSMGRPGQDLITYTRELRRKAIKSLDAQISTRSGRLLGRLTRLNTDAGTFTFRLSAGRAINGKIPNGSIIPDLKAALDVPGSAVLNIITCTFKVRGSSGPLSISAVSGVEVFECSEQHAVQLHRLAETPNGWLDGQGCEVPLPALERTRDLLVLLESIGMPSPGVFARPEGGVNVEWLSALSHVVIEIDGIGSMDAFAYDQSTDSTAELETNDVEAVVSFAKDNVNG